ncbi:MAG: hypothetical protein QGG40_15240, partial [Myxococcota bacterium]|nr:hypothetical protein [Myxococcota bacterium]
MLSHGIVHEQELPLDRVRQNLEAMDRGGIHDQLGGGFHRYTVDAEWRIPHFEKMLYDNGQLLRLYAEGAIALEEPRFAQVAEAIVAHLERDMLDHSGLFWASWGADSEGEEGTYYVWTLDEVTTLLENPAPFATAYQVTRRGSFEAGTSVLIRQPGTDPNSEALVTAREQLLAVRYQRIPPDVDDKFVVAWNGLAVGGLARAGRLLERPHFVSLATNAAGTLLDTVGTGPLPRTLAANAPMGVVEDYAFVAEGLLDLYEADPNPRWLIAADRLAGQLVNLFEDPHDGGFFQASSQVEDLLVRRKDLTDGAEPSGAGRAVDVLVRLAAYGAPAAQGPTIERAMTASGLLLERSPASVPTLASVADRLSRTSTEVVLATPRHDHPDLAPFLEIYNQRYRPHSVLAVVTPEDLGTLSAFKALQGKSPSQDSVRAFVCFDQACKFPTSDPEKFAAQLAAPLPTP